MAQIRLPFPGEGEHGDRLLRTAAYLIERGRLTAALDVLQLLRGVELLPEQLDELERLAARGGALARAQRAPLRFDPPLPAGVLAFRSRVSPTISSKPSARPAG